jgi:hypothetical protein
MHLRATATDVHIASRRPRGALVLLFVLLMLAPAMAFLLAVDGGGPGEFPLPERGALMSYPRAMRDYVSTHFSLRQSMVRVNGLARIRALGVSPTPRVIVGREGWLFYGNEESVSSYRHSDPLSPERLAEWTRRLVARTELCASHGSRYYLLVVPDKHTIYPEFMPAGFPQNGGPSRMDQLLSHLRAHTAVRAIDIRPALLAAKSTGRLYQQTDTHWNDLGAYVGYRELILALAADDPRFKPAPRESFTQSSSVAYGRDLANMMGVGNDLPEELITLTPAFAPPQIQETGPFSSTSVQPDPRLPTLFLFHASFSERLMPMLSPHFSVARYRSFLGFDYGEFGREGEPWPSVIISEFVERDLGLPLVDDNMPTN